MNSYIDTIKVTDKNGNKSILYPNTKKEAVYGLVEDLEKLSVPDITATMDVVMPNSHDGRFLFKKIKGVCEQITTTGKNHMGSRVFDSDIREVKGITYTLVRDDNGYLKYINANGTADGASTLAISLSANMELTVGESYILSGCPSGGGINSYRMHFYNINGSGTFIYDLGAGQQFVFSNETNDYNVAININSGVTVNNLKFYPMIRLASVADDTYEPYTGGLPAPSPNYPQEIKKSVVSGIKTHGVESYKESTITLSNPIDLYGIGDVQDVIEDGKVKRRYGKVVFDGSADEYWYSENNYFRLQGVNTDNTVPILCSHLRQTKIYDEINGVSGTIWVIINGFSINMTGICSTVAELRSWLAENQLTVIYGLPTPTEEELPLADQIALNSIATYDGITHLEFDSEVKPTFEGEYGTSKAGGYTLEGMLAGRNGELMGKDYANRIAALETAMVNNI